MGDMQVIPGLRRLTDGLTPASAAYVAIVLATAAGVFTALVLGGFDLGNPTAVSAWPPSPRMANTRATFLCGAAT